jgi:hypothetical protein
MLTLFAIFLGKDSFSQVLGKGASTQLVKWGGIYYSSSADSQYVLKEQSFFQTYHSGNQPKPFQDVIQMHLKNLAAMPTKAIDLQNIDYDIEPDQTIIDTTKDKISCPSVNNDHEELIASGFVQYTILTIIILSASFL